MFAMIGAHRTGKTTLAKALAERYEIPFCKTRSGEALRSLGVSPKEELGFSTRLKVQSYLLDVLERDYEAMIGEPFVADRSPLDVAAYTTAEIGRTTLQDEQLRHSYESHIARCFELTRRYVGFIVIVPPAIDPVDESDKAPAEIHYMEHLHALAVSFAVKAHSVFEIPVLPLPRPVVENNARVDFISKVAASIIESSRTKRDNFAPH
jgi:hypothetical protein